MTVFSADGARFVRVTPGRSLGDSVGFEGANRGAYARAAFYERQADRSYRLTADVALLNPIAPVDLLLSNAGYLITFDNWHNLGYGKAVAIYGPSGKPVASWQLEQLYPHDQLDSIKKSVSSRWWRCAPFHFVDLTSKPRSTCGNRSVATSCFSFRPASSPTSRARPTASRRPLRSRPPTSGDCAAVLTALAFGNSSAVTVLPTVPPNQAGRRPNTEMIAGSSQDTSRLRSNATAWSTSLLVKPATPSS